MREASKRPEVPFLNFRVWLGNYESFSFFFSLSYPNFLKWMYFKTSEFFVALKYKRSFFIYFKNFRLPNILFCYTCVSVHLGFMLRKKFLNMLSITLILWRKILESESRIKTGFQDLFGDALCKERSLFIPRNLEDFYLKHFIFFLFLFLWAEGWLLLLCGVTVLCCLSF